MCSGLKLASLKLIRSSHPKEQGQLNCHTDILLPPSSRDNNASVQDTLVTRGGMGTLCSRKDVCGPSSSAGIIAHIGDINSRLAWRTATAVHIWLIARTLSAILVSHYFGYIIHKIRCSMKNWKKAPYSCFCLCVFTPWILQFSLVCLPSVCLKRNEEKQKFKTTLFA